MLKTKGFLPPAYLVPVRAGLATYNGGEQAESRPNPSKGEWVCLVPYLVRGLGFPIHPFLREAIGVLRPPVAQPYACLPAAYRGIRSPLRIVIGL